MPMDDIYISCHELRAEDLAQSFGAKLDLEWVKISGISHHQDDITLGTVSWFWVLTSHSCKEEVNPLAWCIWFICNCFKKDTRPETNVALENRWLED